MNSLARWVCFVIAVSLFVASNSAAQKTEPDSPELRVDTSLYFGDKTSPISQNVTLFQSGLVYDFSSSNSDSKSEEIEITIYDSQTKMFTLLDINRKIKFTIPQTRLVQLTEALRAQTSQNPELKFLTSADYTETSDQNSGWTTVDGEVIKYRFKGKQLRNPQNFDSYCEFLNQYTLLAVTDPRRTPPFARLRLNESIKKKGVVPTDIRLDMRKTPPMQKALTMKSRHTFVESLSKTDKAKIESAIEKLASYKTVSLSTYRGLSAAEASKDASIKR